MYIVLEYVAYLSLVIVFAGLLFGVTVLFVLTESGAERLTKATLHVANRARALAADLVHAKMFWRGPSST